MRHFTIGQVWKNNTIAAGFGIINDGLLIAAIHLVGAEGPDLFICFQCIRRSFAQVDHVIINIQHLERFQQSVEICRPADGRRCEHQFNCPVNRSFQLRCIIGRIEQDTHLRFAFCIYDQTFGGSDDPIHPFDKGESTGALPFSRKRVEPVKGFPGIALAARVATLREHVVVPAGKAVGHAGLIEEFHLPWIRHHVIFTGAALEFSCKKRLVPLHGMGYVIDDPVVVQITVRKEFRNMVDAEHDLTFIPKKIIIHGDVDRKFIAVSIDPSGEVMIERNGYPPFPGLGGEQSQVVAVIASPETVPFIITATVGPGCIGKSAVGG